MGIDHRTNLIEQQQQSLVTGKTTGAKRADNGEMVLTHVEELDDAAAASAVVFTSRYVQEPLPRSNAAVF